MKCLLTGLASLILTSSFSVADVIAQWNFNSPVSDGSTGTGTEMPSIGQGFASLVGEVTASFASGDKADPAATDNSGWNTAHYPTKATNNLSAGPQFNVDTSGYEKIVLSWSQRNSSTASRYSRLQYTVDGVEFLSSAVVWGGDTVFTNVQVDLSNAPGVADNPLFAFRVVSEFESSATGFGEEVYVGTSGSYSTSGTIRFDLVTVSGTPLASANTPPGISQLRDQVARVRQSTEQLVFSVSDGQDSPELLYVSCNSSDPSVVADWDIVVEGMGASRTVRVTAGSDPGITTITLTVTDSGGRFASTTFQVTVLPLNTAPCLALTSLRTNTVAGAPVSVPVTVWDMESESDSLGLAAYSENEVLAPNSAIAAGGSGSNRFVTITPPQGCAGITCISITVSDGAETAATRLGLLVTASPVDLLYEPFSYADGPLTNSGYWTTRSGVAAQAQVSAGALMLTSAQTEDVVARLAGAPYVVTNGIVLYSSFNLRCVSLAPKSMPGLLAHFADGSMLRGRVYVMTTNAAQGAYRLMVANGENAGVELPVDLVPEADHRVVTRYEIDSASTTLWLDPANESDASVTAVDPHNPSRVVAYGFRQDADIGGDFLVDDLRVGTSFAAVLGQTPPPIVRLGFLIDNENLVLTWNQEGYVLQSATTSFGPYTDEPAASSPYPVSTDSEARFFRLRAR